MSRAICVASGKGGTGKTSVASGIACCLAALGKRVVILDADVGLRNMDIVLGVSDAALFDFTDVLSGNISLSRALLAHPLVENLFLLSAPLGESAGRDTTPQELADLVREIKGMCDFCIIDCPAGLDFGFNLAAAAADAAILVATPDTVSLRDAQLTRAALKSRGIKDIRLVVNRVRPSLIRKLYTANIDEAIDRTATQLLGIVPEDKAVIEAANNGKLLFSNLRAPAARAYRNIAKRICGESVPLMKISRKI
ncbi:MAG: septum site-determining protein MinD [Oscillospiraceae bacterium]|nr:septum site-determining protein MinD [Oscillospiraceae bacterium]MBQ4544739.1 septum site-determining protein MinD [Oscillospiraceae bacterium]MBQ6902830.1 septum site-determining protein MinD [Oscillospiraceae bacterium]